MADATDQETLNSYLLAQAMKLSVADLRRGAEESGAEFLAAVDAITDEVAHRTPRPGDWSVAEVVDHVALTMDDVVSIMRVMATGRPPTKGLTVNAAPVNGMKPLGELLARLRASESSALAFLAANERAPHADLRFHDEYFGEMTWKAYAVILRSHYKDHTGQVRETLAAVA